MLHLKIDIESLLTSLRIIVVPLETAVQLACIADGLIFHFADFLLQIQFLTKLAFVIAFEKVKWFVLVFQLIWQDRIFKHLKVLGVEVNLVAEYFQVLGLVDGG